jgi:hypothetical protein
MTMAIKARIGNIVFEIETESDLRMFLATAKAGAVSLGAAPSSESVAARLRRFRDRLGSRNQRAVIDALIRSPDGLTDVEIRAALGLETNSALAGIMAAISKNASAVGLQLEHVLTKRVLPGPDAWYRYRLSSEMREVVTSK